MDGIGLVGSTCLHCARFVRPMLRVPMRLRRTSLSALTCQAAQVIVRIPANVIAVFVFQLDGRVHHPPRGTVNASPTVQLGRKRTHRQATRHASGTGISRLHPAMNTSATKTCRTKNGRNTDHDRLIQVVRAMVGESEVQRVNWAVARVWCRCWLASSYHRHAL